ncbi:uncharacterized protein LOC122790475 isoform X2 [Protopterus annectens]|uniref:uncharacterized protein LOC122790475 isoform X2 n=1 Tax=Protopterus annectens TaxID=7888 RepID=UPI001CFB11CD|nr:uncharacterized protein LOC122790475 isoform X2 [Protopterus annectens]
MEYGVLQVQPGSTAVVNANVAELQCFRPTNGDDSVFQEIDFVVGENGQVLSLREGIVNNNEAQKSLFQDSEVSVTGVINNNEAQKALFQDPEVSVTGIVNDAQTTPFQGVDVSVAGIVNINEVQVDPEATVAGASVCDICGKSYKYFRSFFKHREYCKAGISGKGENSALPSPEVDIQMQGIPNRGENPTLPSREVDIHMKGIPNRGENPTLPSREVDIHMKGIPNRGENPTLPSREVDVHVKGTPSRGGNHALPSSDIDVQVKATDEFSTSALSKMDTSDIQASGRIAIRQGIFVRGCNKAHFMPKISSEEEQIGISSPVSAETQNVCRGSSLEISVNETPSTPKVNYCTSLHSFHQYGNENPLTENTVCDVCGKKYKYVRNLWTHRRKHDDTGPPEEIEAIEQMPITPEVEHRHPHCIQQANRGNTSDSATGFQSVTVKSEPPNLRYMENANLNCFPFRADKGNASNIAVGFPSFTIKSEPPSFNCMEAANLTWTPNQSRVMSTPDATVEGQIRRQWPESSPVFTTPNGPNVMPLLFNEQIKSTDLERIPGKQDTPCKIYGTTFGERKCSLVDDRSAYFKLMPFKCLFCPQGFRHATEMRKHIHKCHGGKEDTLCQICGTKFARRNGLLDHIQFVHYKHRPFKCQFCPQGYCRPSELRRHIQKSHGEVMQNVVRSDSFESMVEDKSTAEKVQILPENDILKTEKKARIVVQCSLCATTFTRRTSLRKHIQFVHQRYRPHRCTFCNQGFCKPSEMNKHVLRRHSAPLPTQKSPCNVQNVVQNSTPVESISGMQNLGTVTENVSYADLVQNRTENEHEFITAAALQPLGTVHEKVLYDHLLQNTTGGNSQLNAAATQQSFGTVAENISYVALIQSPAGHKHDLETAAGPHCFEPVNQKLYYGHLIQTPSGSYAELNTAAGPQSLGNEKMFYGHLIQNTTGNYAELNTASNQQSLGMLAEKASYVDHVQNRIENEQELNRVINLESFGVVNEKVHYDHLIQNTKGNDPKVTKAPSANHLAEMGFTQESSPALNSKSDVEMVSPSGTVSENVSYNHVFQNTVEREVQLNVAPAVQPFGPVAEKASYDHLTQSKTACDSKEQTVSTPSFELNHFPCKNCKQMFSSHILLRRHQAKHHYIRRKKMFCLLCGARFLRSKDLDKHLVGSHSPNFKYKCKFCAQGFQQSRALLKHIIMAHCDLRNVLCHICKRKFGTASRLQEHVIKLHSKGHVQT